MISLCLLVIPLCDRPSTCSREIHLFHRMGPSNCKLLQNPIQRWKKSISYTMDHYGYDIYSYVHQLHWGPIFLVAFSPSAKDSRWWFPNPPLLAFNAASRRNIRSTFDPKGMKKCSADGHVWWRRHHSQPTLFSDFLGLCLTILFKYSIEFRLHLLKLGYERLVCGCLDCLDHGFHQTFRVDQHIWSLRIWFVNQVLTCFNH